MSSHDHLRASDRDRDEVTEWLREAATEGRLAPDEFDERLTRALTATTYGQLSTLTSDLPVRRPVAPPIRPALAGFWRRLGAWLIDSVIVGLMIGILAHPLHGAGVLLALIVALLYFTYFEGGPDGAGAGKRVMGLRVISARTGGRLGYGRAAVRCLARVISAIPLYLGYFWMLGEGEGRCWHDMIAGDLVIHRDGRPELQQSNRPY